MISLDRIAPSLEGHYHTPHRFDFVQLVSSDKAVRHWRPGLDIAGFTPRGGKILTTGKPSDEYAGMRIVDEDFIPAEGWIKIDRLHLDLTAFRTPQVEIIAIGSPVRYFGDCASWTLFAIRSEDCHPHRLPSEWKNFKEQDILDHFVFEARRAEGWMDAKSVTGLLGMSSANPTIEGVINKWMSENYPYVSALKRGILFAPVSLDDLCQHERFYSLFATLFGDACPFAIACMFNEKIRAAVVAGMIK